MNPIIENVYYSDNKRFIAFFWISESYTVFEFNTVHTINIVQSGREEILNKFSFLFNPN